MLDELGIALCVGIGDGAGANILARFGLAHPERVLGLVLVNLVSAGVGFLESIKERLFSAKRRSSQQLASEEIVAMHKVSPARKGCLEKKANAKEVVCTGSASASTNVAVDGKLEPERPITYVDISTPTSSATTIIPATTTTATNGDKRQLTTSQPSQSASSSSPQPRPTTPSSSSTSPSSPQFGAASDEAMKQLIENYSSSMSKINSKNLRKYLSAYMNRKEINELAGLDVLLVTGSKSPFAAGVEHIYAKCNKSKTSMLKVDGAVDIFR